MLFNFHSFQYLISLRTKIIVCYHEALFTQQHLAKHECAESSKGGCSNHQLYNISKAWLVLCSRVQSRSLSVECFKFYSSAVASKV